MADIRQLLLIVGGVLACGSAWAAGPAMPPIATPTPVSMTTASASQAGSPSGTDSATSSSDSLRASSEADLLAHRASLEAWVTWLEVSTPTGASVGAARELPLGFRAAGATSVFLLAPSFRAELQTPPIHIRDVRLYAAGAAVWMYASSVRPGRDARAWGYGPKLGVEWRIPTRSVAAHGWHVGADAGVLFGDWHPIFGQRFRRGVPAVTPLRVGYYW